MFKSTNTQKRFLKNVIQFEGDNQTLVWKHPVENFNMGSLVVVDESQTAIFYKNGQALDCFPSGKYELSAERLPLLGKIMELPTGGATPFPCKVYFVNHAVPKNMKWGTPNKIGVADPSSGMYVELGAGGVFSVTVREPRKLLFKIVGTTGGMTQEELIGSDHGSGYFRSLILTLIKSTLAQAIRQQNLCVMLLDEHLMELSDALQDKINERLEEYGIALELFTVERILLPMDDPDFVTMRRRAGEQYLRVQKEEMLKAEARAQIDRRIVEEEGERRLKEIRAQGDADAQRIRRKADADSYYYQAEAEAANMKMKGYTYQDETARQVSLEAMKHEGNGMVSAMSEAARLGASLGIVGGVANMTQNALQGRAYPQQAAPQTSSAVNASVSAWKCPNCGTEGNTENFCEECAQPRPITWDCPTCGRTGNKGNFCPRCRTKRPEKSSRWTCPTCGQEGNEESFCENCGFERTE